MPVSGKPYALARPMIDMTWLDEFPGISSETFADLRAYDVTRARIDRARIAQRRPLLQSAVVKPLIGLRLPRRGKTTSRP
jgi:hypothetical protein